MTVLAYLVAACLYAGFQLTVRLLVYPQLAAVPDEAFAPYERSHQRRITPLVGVLFALLAATTFLLLLDGSVPRAGAVAAATLFGAVLAVTGGGAVPQHRVLSRAFDASTYGRLLRWDTVRCALALLQVGVAAWLTLRS